MRTRAQQVERGGSCTSSGAGLARGADVRSASPARPPSLFVGRSSRRPAPDPTTLPPRGRGRALTRGVRGCPAHVSGSAATRVTAQRRAGVNRRGPRRGVARHGGRAGRRRRPAPHRPGPHAARARHHRHLLRVPRVRPVPARRPGQRHPLPRPARRGAGRRRLPALPPLPAVARGHPAQDARPHRRAGPGRLAPGPGRRPRLPVPRRRQGPRPRQPPAAHPARRRRRPGQDHRDRHDPVRAHPPRPRRAHPHRLPAPRAGADPERDVVALRHPLRPARLGGRPAGQAEAAGQPQPVHLLPAGHHLDGHPQAGPIRPRPAPAPLERRRHRRSRTTSPMRAPRTTRWPAIWPPPPTPSSSPRPPRTTAAGSPSPSSSACSSPPPSAPTAGSTSAPCGAS